MEAMEEVDTEEEAVDMAEAAMAEVEVEVRYSYFIFSTRFQCFSPLLSYSSGFFAGGYGGGFGQGAW